MAKYIIYADEAWVHRSQPLNRYHNFFGGIFGEEKYIDRLNADLTKIINKYSLPRIEIKWSNLDSRNNDMYKELIICLSNHIISGKIRYRQMFKDRSYHYVGESPGTELDVQFKQYYQFLKLAFGFQYLDQTPENHHIILRLDTHSSQQHKDELERFITQAPSLLERNDINHTVTYINSSRNICLQVCDILMGAAGYYGNQVYKRRINGARKITEKQKLKRDFCKFTYEVLKRISALDRGTKAFNWFETTGIGSDFANYLKHKLRIWKFVSFPYYKNKGWEKDHLNNQGLFVKDDFLIDEATGKPKVFTRS